MDGPRFGEIADLCNRISIFQSRANWRFKSMPVICWEFADVGDYMHAREMLGRAISEVMRHTGADVRLVDRSTVEMDVCGVTFRLSCQTIYATPDGEQRGVNELRYGKDYMTNQTPPNPGMK